MLLYFLFRATFLILNTTDGKRWYVDGVGEEDDREDKVCGDEVVTTVDWVMTDDDVIKWANNGNGVES